MLVPLPGLSYSGHAAIALLAFAVIMWASEAQVLAGYYELLKNLFFSFEKKLKVLSKNWS